MNRNLKAGMRVKYQTRDWTGTGEILWRLVDCDGTVTYSVRESTGYAYGVSSADVMEVVGWWDAQAIVSSGDVMEIES